MHDQVSCALDGGVVDPGMLGVVGFVSTSHNITDHLDAVTAHSIAQANPAVKPG